MGRKRPSLGGEYGIRTLVAVALLTLILAVPGLAAGPPPTASDAVGTVEVEVRYHGAPATDRLKITRDVAVCGLEAQIERIVVGPAKGLGNAVVGIPDVTTPAVSRKVQIEEKGCQLRPHVTVMAPGEVEFLNADGVLHTIRLSSTSNPPAVRGHPKSRRTISEKLEKPEIVRVTCDVHPWMLAWIAVVPSAAFALTDDSGVVRIEKIPAGKHQVEVWHEVLGRQTKEVDVKVGQTARVSFEMKR